MPGGAMPSGAKAVEPPRALREVERLTRNPEKLANADGRCSKDTLGKCCPTFLTPQAAQDIIIRAHSFLRQNLTNSAANLVNSAAHRGKADEIPWVHN